MKIIAVNGRNFQDVMRAALSAQVSTTNEPILDARGKRRLLYLLIRVRLPRWSKIAIWYELTASLIFERDYQADDKDNHYRGFARMIADQEGAQRIGEQGALLPHD